MVEFVGGPLCGYMAGTVGTLTLVAVKSPVASYAMYSAEAGYRAVDPARCTFDTVESIESPKHVYAFEGMGAAGVPVLMYVGVQ